EQANLLTYFDETHSIEGEFVENKLTVTLDYAYVDANRITIGYTVRGESPTGERMMAYSNPTLMTADGQPIDRLLLQANQEEQTPPEEGSTGAFGMKLTTNFIASDFDLADGEMLNLRLIVEVALSYLDSGEFPAPGMMMAGITEFNFSVPFISGTVMEVTQSAEVSQKMVELQRVVLTPSMTRLDMCYQLPAVTQLPGWSPFMILSVDEQPVFTGQTETYGIGDRYDLNSPCRSVIVPLPLATHIGEWQVEIVEFRDLGSFTATVAGPWVFTFSFPEN
ncbi:MAG: DUF4179 domain-containing protein, partial [Anaerolineae bacterium]|nr:DUF4179 domain-containing protein [Anaerolineae bacterium]